MSPAETLVTPAEDEAPREIETRDREHDLLFEARHALQDCAEYLNNPRGRCVPTLGEVRRVLAATIAKLDEVLA